MSGPVIRGWCPGALRPMLSGDGWLVRIRPPMGELSPEQARGVAKASLTHGNGVIDLSSRANLQLRGVREGAHAALIADLRALGLVDADEVAESARNVVITPFRSDGPPTPSLPHSGGREALETQQLARELTAALASMPPLPSKFGFALDTGPAPVLGAVSADIRLERATDGGLIMRPDGHPLGRPVPLESALSETVLQAKWFYDQGGIMNGRGRMAALIARGIIPEGCTTPPAASVPIPLPGLRSEGAVVALAFGQMQAHVLTALSDCDHRLRLTPWRMILLVGATTLPQHPDLIVDPADPLLNVTACTGAPGCAQALGPTRALARALAPQGAGHMHVSGCTKGCAHPGPADTTLVATRSGYNLIRAGSASDAPHRRDLPAHLIPEALHAP